MTNTSNSKQNISGNENAVTGVNMRGPKNTRKKVYVGMSGGVDSSVSALLLKEQGYDVTGVFIKVWQPDNTDCGWKDERRDAMRVAAVLDIPFLTFDFNEQYKREVVDYMIEEYRAGRTPNPDIMCNRHVKFGSFLKQALADGVDFVATGHYAQNMFNTEKGVYELHEGSDKNKDQSYFLWTLGQADLKHILFPIGHLQKSEVRKIAEKHGFPVFDKKDSQGVCFIGHLDMKEFLKSNIETKKGDVLNIAGEVIGEHDGAALYTIGERHGFLITKSTEDGTDGTHAVHESHFIISKNILKNTITVTPKSEFENQIRLAEVAPKEVRLDKVNLDAAGSFNFTDSAKKYSARIRYRQEKQACLIKKDGEQVFVTFDQPQKGLAEGQSLVLYDQSTDSVANCTNGDKCLGGGILNFI